MTLCAPRLLSSSHPKTLCSLSMLPTSCAEPVFRSALAGRSREKPRELCHSGVHEQGGGPAVPADGGEGPRWHWLLWAVAH